MRSKRKYGATFYAAILVLCIFLIGTQVPVKAAAEDGTLQGPRINEYGISTWDCIYFGRYPQEKNEDGTFVESPIKWRVLSVDGKDAFLLADKNLDAMPYNIMEDDLKFYCLWDNCTLRSWLNGYDASYNKSGVDYTQDNFIDRAFTVQEQEAIIEAEVVNDKEIEYKHHPEDYEPLDTNDKIYLLDFYEVMDPRLGFANSEEDIINRVTLNTAYTAAGGSSGSPYMRPEDTKNSWLLRSPGEYSTYVDFITEDGGYDDVLVDGNMITSTDHGIRPVLHLDLSHTDLYTYAGTCTARYTQKITAASQYQKRYGSGSFTLSAQTDGDGALEFSSDNEAVAAVDGSGNVTVCGIGEAVITITAPETERYEKATREVRVTILQGIPQFGISDSKRSIKEGSFILDACTDTDGALSYASSDPSVAEVAPDGTVTLKQPGKTQITVISGETDHYAGGSASMWLTVDKAKSSIALKEKTVTYDGRVVKIQAASVIGSSGQVTYQYYSDKACKKKLSGAPKNAGVYYVKATVAADRDHQAATSLPVRLTIKKAAAQIKVKKSLATFNVSNVRKKQQSFFIGATVNSKGRLSYAAQSGSKRLSVSKNGKVSVKKGTAKGTYQIKVKIKAAGDRDYNAAVKTVTIKVRVR
ncbi:MAG: hypothetical protein HFH56_06420 [Lachnospiraceae bacterium]|jgi:hypothetical protein|nr:hypothetical protein [Lachnospiraceae bacterium]